MTGITLLLVPLCVAAALSAALTPLVRRVAFAIGAIDNPGPRKVHRTPVPRLGGLAIVAAAAITLLATAQLAARPDTLPISLAAGVVLGLIPIIAVSIVDDIRPLGPLPRFSAQAIGASIAVAYGISLEPTVHLFGHSVDIGYFAILLSILWLVGVTNAFNIVDGLDGLSAGLALISAGSLATIFLAVHQIAMAAVTLAVAGAIVGFLPFNLYPARIFLGETGATAIGFTLACFALKGGSTLSAGFAVLLPIAVMGLPVAETLVSMLRRVIRKLEARTANGVFEADRNHFHHRLLDLGIDHRKAVLILYGAGVGTAAAGLLSILMTAVEAGLLLMALLLAALVGLSRLGYEEFAVIRSGLVLRFYEAPVLRKSLFAVFADLVAVSLAVYVAIVLRFEDVTLMVHHDEAVLMLAVLAPMTVGSFWSFGLYRGTWRLASVDDFYRVCLAVATSTLLAFLFYQIISRHSGSLSVFAIYALVKLVIANGGRVSYRVLVTKRWRAINRGIPVLVYGAGVAGASAVRELLSNQALGMCPVGFLDDDLAMVGSSVNGYPILGGIDSLRTHIQRTGARAVVISSEKIPPVRREQAQKICDTLGVRLLRMRVSFENCDLTTAARERRGSLRIAPAEDEVGT